MKTYKPGGAGAATPAHAATNVKHKIHNSGEYSQQAKPFPIHCLPPSVAAMARAIAETERTPASLAGCCTLGIVSASIGAGVRVRSGPDRFTRGNLNIVGSAESGSGKSETFRHSSHPFHEFERELVEAWRKSTLPGLQTEKDMIEAEIAAEIAKVRKNGGRKDGKGPDASTRDEIKARLEKKKADLAAVEAQLHAPVLSVEDVTSERLASLLAVRDETLASLSADAGGIVNNLLGRYSKLDRTDEGIYLKAYSGDFCRVDRQTRQPILLQSPCLAILWLVQPDKVETLLAERSLTDGGLIPRLLIAHTHADPRPIIEGATGIPATVQADYRQTIRALLENYRMAGEPLTIEPSPQALAAMNAHFNGIVDRRKSDLKDVSTFAARWSEQAWRIAVCLHAAEHPSAADDHPLEVETAERAIELADWFAEQQLEILSAGRHKAKRETRDKVLALLADNPKGIRASDLYRARITRHADEAHGLLAAMEAEGELTGRDEKPVGGGHVTRIYRKAKP